MFALGMFGWGSSARAVFAENLPLVNADSAVEQVLSAANEYWGTSPKCVMVSVYEGQLREHIAAEALQPGCEIIFSPLAMGWLHSRVPSLEGMACVTMVHEYGHLLGHDHVSDPHNVMYPSIIEARWVGPCAAYERGSIELQIEQEPTAYPSKHRHKAKRFKNHLAKL